MVLWHLGCVYLFKLVFSTQEWGGSYGNYTFSFLRNLHTVFPQWLHQFVFAPTVYEGSLFSKFFPTVVICRLLEDSCYSDRCEVIPFCGSGVHFSNSQRCWASFHIAVSHLYDFFGKKSLFSSSAHFLTGLFFDIKLHEVLGYFGY